MVVGKGSERQWSMTGLSAHSSNIYAPTPFAEHCGGNLLNSTTNVVMAMYIPEENMSEMVFDDFDYDRHSDNCECEECRAELVESLPTDKQHINDEKPAEICPNCTNGMNMDHTGLFGGSRKCITCGGIGKLRYI